MSYESHFLSEAKLACVAKADQELVLKMLKPISDEGHSGGSMSIFIQWLEDWANNPQPITDKRSMLYPVQESVKGLPYEDLKRIAGYVYKTCAFEPLTPLTGVDSEWIDHGDGYYQNRRYSKVFKEGKDATPYCIDRVVWCYPYNDFSGWGGCTRGGGLSSKDITFPYDPAAPENATEYKYFLADDWREELPVEIPPKAWLKWQRQRYHAGTDLTTGKLRLGVVCLGDVRLNEIIIAYAAVKTHIEVTEGLTVERAIRKLGWVWDCDDETWLDCGCTTIKTADLAQKVIYLLTTEPKDIAGYAVQQTKILKPGKMYQRWSHYRDDYFGWMPNSDKPTPIYVENDRIITGDHDDYLFQQRRKYGYAHPKRKEHTLSSENIIACSGGLPPLDAADPA